MIPPKFTGGENLDAAETTAGSFRMGRKIKKAVFENGRDVKYLACRFLRQYDLDLTKYFKTVFDLALSLMFLVFLFHI